MTFRNGLLPAPLATPVVAGILAFMLWQELIYRLANGKPRKAPY